MADSYKVIGLPEVRAALAQWKAEYSRPAYEVILKAMETMARQLAQAPEECGEPQNNISPNGVIHTAFQHPLIVKFAVFRDDKAVIIKRLILANWTPEQ